MSHKHHFKWSMNLNGWLCLCGCLYQQSDRFRGVWIKTMQLDENFTGVDDE